MVATVTRIGNRISLQMTMELTGSMLDMENTIQAAVNEVGNLATKEALVTFDASGDPINIANIKLSSKGKVAKEYATPYGVIRVKRHVYQTAAAGETFCPVDDRARIIANATPKLAQILTYKYALLSAENVAADLSSNHGRKTLPLMVQQTAAVVINIAQAVAWNYELPQAMEAIATISISLGEPKADCCSASVMRKAEIPVTTASDANEALTAAIALYNPDGIRVHTLYLGATPESGNPKFLAYLHDEVTKVKQQYPHAQYLGISDGVASNLEFLKENTQAQLLDFQHAADYLAGAAYAFSAVAAERKAWLHQALHELKHSKNAAPSILRQMQAQALKIKDKKKFTAIIKDNLNAAVIYFTKHLAAMNYFDYSSSVTDAKSLIKQQLCNSTLRCGGPADLRALVTTPERWSQFWNKINQNGIMDIQVGGI